MSPSLSQVLASLKISGNTSLVVVARLVRARLPVIVFLVVCASVPVSPMSICVLSLSFLKSMSVPVSPRVCPFCATPFFGPAFCPAFLRGLLYFTLFSSRFPYNSLHLSVAKLCTACDLLDLVEEDAVRGAPRRSTVAPLVDLNSKTSRFWCKPACWLTTDNSSVSSPKPAQPVTNQEGHPCICPFFAETDKIQRSWRLRENAFTRCFKRVQDKIQDAGNSIACKS